MHPSGVQFGLSRGLLQLRGEEILLSDQLLGMISLQAQMYLQLGRPAIRGNFLLDITVRAAQDALGNHYQGRREEIVPFFASGRVTLNRTCASRRKSLGTASATIGRVGHLSLGS